MYETNSKVALVTGAASGLGRAIAERLAGNGFKVTIADLDGELAQKIAAEIVAAGRQAFGVQLDVREEAAVKEAYSQMDRRFGRVDVLVNCAAIAGALAPLEDTELAAWEMPIHTNLTGVFLMCRSAIPLMRRNRWGRIINLSSLADSGQLRVLRSGFVASKVGVLGFSRVLADEVGRDGITVNCLAPSTIVTDNAALLDTEGTEGVERGAGATLVGRPALSIDVAHAVGWLCSERAGFVTGTVLDFNGGAMML